MKFIHIADVHLGARPEGIKVGNGTREQEIWESFENVLQTCEWEEIDLLLIAGDLFHRQPLMRELKEVNYLFSKLTKTKVVLIAGNHDYIKPDSYYLSFEWNENVHFLTNGHLGCVEFPELQTAVYGLSYYQKEITERLYDQAKAMKRQPCEILLAHGGDEKHIPFQKESLRNLGYDYIALGHIHKPQAVIEQLAVYAGALEPSDRNDYGAHGYVKGIWDEKGTRVSFVKSAKREYRQVVIEVDETMTSGAVREEIKRQIQEQGIQHMYQFELRGFCDADIQFDLDGFHAYGNVLEIVDHTSPSYSMEELLKKNKDNLLGKFILSLKDTKEGTIEHLALYEGVHALMSTKRS